MITRLLICLFSLMKIIKAQINSCNNLSCFECASHQNCEWNNKQCKLSYKPYDSMQWFLNYNLCENDRKSIEIMKTHCFGLNDDTVPMLGSLKNVNGQYGMKYLYCKYTILGNNTSVIVSIDNKEQSNMKEDKYTIIYYYNDNSSSTNRIDKFPYKASVKINRLIFMYNAMNGPYSTEPFVIEITLNKGLDVLQIISITIGSVIGGFFLSIFIYAFFLYIRSCFMKEEPQQNIISAYLERLQELHQNPSLGIQIKREQMEKIFHEIFHEIPYDINKSKYGTICTICRETLIERESIIELKCLHYFHPKCITKHILNGNLHQKCPNCNSFVFNIKTQVAHSNIHSNEETQRQVDGSNININPQNRSTFQTINSNNLAALSNNQMMNSEVIIVNRSEETNPVTENNNIEHTQIQLNLNNPP